MKQERYDMLLELLEHYDGRLTVYTDTGIVSGVRPYTTGKGYLSVKLYKKNKQYDYRVHEIVAVVGGLDIVGKQVNHKNGQKQDNRLENLEPMTNAENKKHAVENGLIATREQLSHIKPRDVAQIKVLYAQGLSQREIGERYDVGQQAISKILKEENRHGSY